MMLNLKTCAFGLVLSSMFVQTGCAGAPGGGGGGGGGGAGGVLPDGATSAPRVRGISISVEDVRLSTAAAPRYGTPVEQPLIAAEAALVEAMNGAGLRHDPGLSRAARELARTAPDRTNVPGALITGITSWVGLFDPPPRLAISELPRDGAPCGDQVGPSCREAIAMLAKAARESVRQLTRGGVYFGVGVTALPDGTIRLVVALTERGAAIEPMAKALPAGGRAEIRGRLLGKRQNPSFEVFDPQGRWTPIPAKISRGEFVGQFSCERGRGAYQVEVLAEGTYGPEVVANFPLYCGEDPPGALRVEVERLDASVDAGEVARANFAALNDTRARQGLPLLQWDNQAAALAQAHSEDMLRSGFVGHTSPTTGDVEDRFARASVKSAVVRENLARGYGPWAIHQGLMQSPGHRVNILATDVTHVGIGVVIAPPETEAKDAPRPILLTQNYYSKVGADAPTSDMPKALRDRVDALRKQKGLAAIGWHRGLSEAAQGFADGIAAGDEGRANKQYDARVEQQKFARVETHRVLAPSFASLDGVKLWSEAVAGAVGVGIAKVAKGKDVGSLIVIIAVGAAR
ncbi:CAP domain-containing protein [Nannocystis bainbridge]|uniref:CAP domain-containing protein n=1 Tax=Nannocystis bainbridge TaxID=2995303 RepID=A0ABT5DV76_9BACT|nr:CAP domain-containing protein [Nannocystis bainbridge]MDC0717043.1 CAP domain-containing protein [Nannocystis bainbridge]